MDQHKGTHPDGSLHGDFLSDMMELKMPPVRVKTLGRGDLKGVMTHIYRDGFWMELHISNNQPFGVNAYVPWDSVDYITLNDTDLS